MHATVIGKKARVDNWWSDEARAAALEARRASAQAKTATAKLPGRGGTAIDHGFQHLTSAAHAHEQAGLAAGRSRQGAFGLAADHHARAAVHHMEAARGDKQNATLHSAAAVAHQQAADANKKAAKLVEGWRKPGMPAFAAAATAGAAHNRAVNVLGNRRPVYNEWREELHPRVAAGGPGGGRFTHGEGGGGQADGAGAAATRDAAEHAKGGDVHQAAAGGGEHGHGGAHSEEEHEEHKMHAAHGGAASKAIATGEETEHLGHVAHGLEEAGHEAVHGVFGHGAAPALGQAAQAGGAVAGGEAGRAGEHAAAAHDAAAHGAAGHAAAAHEAAAHAAPATGHEAAAAGGHEAAAHGVHDPLAGAHGEHDYPGMFSGLSVALEATGGLAGGNIAKGLEKRWGIDKAYANLYDRMKQEHGEEQAEFLHGLSTAANYFARIGVGALLVHSGVFATKLGVGAAVAGAAAASAIGKTGKERMKGGKEVETVESGVRKLGKAAVAGGLGVMSAMGHHLAHEAVHGLAGGAAMSIPGLSYLTLAAANLFGRYALNKTGLSGTKAAQATAKAFRSYKESKLGQAVHGFLHGAHEHVAAIAGAHPVEWSKLVRKHGAVGLKAAATAGKWGRKQAPTAAKVAGSVIGRAGRAIAGGVSRTAAKLKGALPQQQLAGNVLGIDYYDLYLVNAAFAGDDGATESGFDFSPSNPVVKLLGSTMHDILEGMLKSDDGKQAWEQLNTPQGAQFMLAMLHRGGTMADQENA